MTRTTVDVITPEATAEQYAAAHDRIVHLVGHLDAASAQRAVPGTPLWTVHDLLAHLAAIPSEIASGRAKGIPTPEQTQQQVDARRGRSVPELLDEWAAGLPPIVEAARAGLIPAPLAIDAIPHEQDLRGALRVGRLENDSALRYAVTGYCLGLRRKLERDGLAALRLFDPARGLDVTAGEGEAAASVCAPEFELFRALAGRRSRGQVAAYDWAGDAERYLDAFCVFGPLSALDVVD